MEAVEVSTVMEDLLPVPAPELPPDRFLDRELSWLAFNNRVLDLAKDAKRVPLLERAKFLAIFSSNLDEFYMVRVAGLKRRIAAGVAVPTVSGMMPREVHSAILTRTRELVTEQARVFQEDVRPALAKEGIEILRWDELTCHREGSDGRAVRRAHLPGAHPTCRRSITSLPVHLGLVDQPRRTGTQPGDRHSPVRSGQGADDARPLHPAGRRSLRRAGGRDRSPSRSAVQRHAGGGTSRVPGDPQRRCRGGGGRRRESAACPGEGDPSSQGRSAAGPAGGRGRHGPEDARAADQ